MEQDIQLQGIYLRCYFEIVAPLPIQTEETILKMILCEEASRQFLNYTIHQNLTNIVISDLILNKYFECMCQIEGPAINKKVSCRSRDILIHIQQQEQGDIQAKFSFLKTEFPKVKKPFHRFFRKFKPQQPLIYTQKAPGEWVPETHVSTGMETLFIDSTIMKSDRRKKEVILDSCDVKDVLNYGHNLLSNMNLYSLEEASLEYEQKACFPVWTANRLRELEDNHGCVYFKVQETMNEEELKQYKERMIHQHQQLQNHRCLLCHEYTCLSILKWWYYTIFNPSPAEWEILNPPKLIQADMKAELVLKPRLKALIIRSDRERGKTKWFECICNYYSHRIVHFKTTFSQQQCQKLENGWIILVDDFKEDLSLEQLTILKSLIAGEEGVILGKWLAKNYLGHIPCVFLCNSKKQFQKLADNLDISSQARFIDLPPDVYLGPPGTFDKYNSIKGVPNAFLSS